MTSVKDSKTPEAFAEAFKGGLGPANNALLLSCSLGGATLTVYAELGSGAVAGVAGWVAIGSWLASIVLALYLAGRASVPQGHWKRLQFGLASTRHHAAFAMFVLGLMGLVVFTAWSRFNSDRYSKNVLAKVAQDAQRIEEVVSREPTALEALAKVGYTTSSDDVCRAIQARNAQVTGLLAKTGISASNLVLPLGDGMHKFCLEPLLAEPSRYAELEVMLAAVPLSAAELNRYFSLEAAPNASQGLRLEQLLLASEGHAPMTSLNIVRLDATPLMHAVWADNAAAVSGLLSMGADPNRGARIVYLDGAGVRLVSVSPLAEATRLSRGETASLLKDVKAKRSVSRGEYRP